VISVHYSDYVVKNNQNVCCYMVIMMGELFVNFEKEFGNLTADVIAKTNKIPNVAAGTKRKTIEDVDSLFDDIQEILEQMDLEVRSLSGDHKLKCASKLKSYKEEVKTLELNYKKAKVSLSDQEHIRSELLNGDDEPNSESQRSRLLDNSERIERSSRRLDEGYKLCIETEQIGQDILGNLERDRDVMTKTRDRLRGTNTDLNKSSRILTAMMRRVVQNRVVLALVCLGILATICAVIYFLSKK